MRKGLLLLDLRAHLPAHPEWIRQSGFRDEMLSTLLV